MLRLLASRRRRVAEEKAVCLAWKTREAAATAAAAAAARKGGSGGAAADSEAAAVFSGLMRAAESLGDVVAGLAEEDLRALDGAWATAGEAIRAERAWRARPMPDGFLCPITQVCGERGGLAHSLLGA